MFMGVTHNGAAVKYVFTTILLAFVTSSGSLQGDL